VNANAIFCISVICASSVQASVMRLRTHSKATTIVVNTTGEVWIAFMCYGNYGKYQKPTWKMHMNEHPLMWYFPLGNS